MTRSRLNLALLLACVAGALPACAGTAATAPGVGPRTTLSAELFPFTTRAAEFVAPGGSQRTLRVEAADAAAVLWLEGDPAGALRMDVTRAADSIVFSSGPDSTTELIRIGAAPGSEWMSGDTTVHFDGWERISLPGGTFDAARIRARSGPASLEVVQTWWFAPGAGLVKLRSDQGGIFSKEMSLAK
ncbi:MAG: hypothetical protein K8T90_05725 [Planctomycetes bacterium]|nr:hypothetical protein [Planctomycetota bacterium]